MHSLTISASLKDFLCFPEIQAILREHSVAFSWAVVTLARKWLTFHAEI